MLNLIAYRITVIEFEGYLKIIRQRRCKYPRRSRGLGITHRYIQYTTLKYMFCFKKILNVRTIWSTKQIIIKLVLSSKVGGGGQGWEPEARSTNTAKNYELLKVVENRIEQCCAAHIVQCCVVVNNIVQHCCIWLRAWFRLNNLCNIVDNIEQCGQHNIVQSCFQHLVIFCRVEGSEWGLASPNFENCK